jgi:hypothetical protein
MSMYLRPVIEKWDKSVAYSSREHDIADVLVALARQEQAGQVDHRLYGEMRVVYIDQGRTFLDYLWVTDINDMLATIADAGLLSVEAEERDRMIEDLKDLKAKSQAWRGLIDPDDGSLRFHCD